jgi:hypothetical protein
METPFGSPPDRLAPTARSVVCRIDSASLAVVAIATVGCCVGGGDVCGTQSFPNIMQGRPFVPRDHDICYGTVHSTALHSQHLHVLLLFLFVHLGGKYEEPQTNKFTITLSAD